MATNKIAFITGASAGIGEATARRLAEGGYDLIITARRSERLEKLADEIEKTNRRVLVRVLDVRNREQVKNVIDELPEDWKKIDLLVNNAGLASGLSSIEAGDIDDWEAMIDTNIKGLLYVTRNILPLMVKEKAG